MTPLELELSAIEAANLTDLVEQFAELVADSTDAGTIDDPAVARLVPDAYRDDPDAAGEFRRLTQRDLLRRRSGDAGVVLATLLRDGEPVTPATLEPGQERDRIVVTLDAEQLRAWLRTLAAVRLVLASRLGVVDEDDHADDDSRFGVYDWLGYRLETLVRAADRDL